MDARKQKLLDKYTAQLRTGLSLLGTKEQIPTSPNPTESPLPPVSLNLNSLPSATQEVGQQ